MAISMITDLDAEAQLTIGAYTPASSEPNTMNTVAIKGDEVSLVSNFIAGEALGARATLAFGTMVQQSEITVGAGAFAATDSIDFTIGATNFETNMALITMFSPKCWWLFRQTVLL